MPKPLHRRRPLDTLILNGVVVRGPKLWRANAPDAAVPVWVGLVVWPDGTSRYFTARARTRREVVPGVVRDSFTGVVWGG